jgi:hypothetical protein
MLRKADLSLGAEPVTSKRLPCDFRGMRNSRAKSVTIYHIPDSTRQRRMGKPFSLRKPSRRADFPVRNDRRKRGAGTMAWSCERSDVAANKNVRAPGKIVLRHSSARRRRSQASGSADFLVRSDRRRRGAGTMAWSRERSDVAADKNVRAPGSRFVSRFERQKPYKIGLDRNYERRLW